MPLSKGRFGALSVKADLAYRWAMELDYFLLLLFLIPFAIAWFCKVWFRHKTYLDYLLPSFIFFALAFRALFSSFAQIFLSDDIAAFLNEAPNPFVKELGFANLGMGLASLISLFYASPKTLFFASLPYALYLSLSAITHFDASYFWIVSDLITPLTFFILFYLRSRYE